MCVVTVCMLLCIYVSMVYVCCDCMYAVMYICKYGVCVGCMYGVLCIWCCVYM